jgi:hypothetical protein
MNSHTINQMGRSAMNDSLRPGPLRWLTYAYGAGLPSEFNDWVLHDTTSRGWVLRHVSRALVQLAPVVVLVLLFVPGPFWIRGVAVVAATAMGLIFCLAYIIETTDHRLEKAGFPAGTGEAARQPRSAEARTTSTWARLDRIEAKRIRREARRAPKPPAGRVSVSAGAE